MMLVQGRLNRKGQDSTVYQTINQSINQSINQQLNLTSVTPNSRVDRPVALLKYTNANNA